MVRRRATTKIASAVGSSGSRNKREGKNDDGGVIAAVNGSLLDEPYLASPKRKDCKLEKSPQLEQWESEAKLNTKSRSAAMAKSRSDRGCAGRTIGVPLATRSQTRTIENFFKANHAKNATLEVAKEKKIWDRNIDLLEKKKVDTSSSVATHSSNGNVEQLTSELIFDLSEDTNDTDNTELSDELTHCVDFATHRCSLRDSHSSRSSTSGSNTENIFLQEPVLKLIVDKTPNQASSIKINTSLEIEPVFSSPPALTTAAFNGRFNQIVSLNSGLVQPDNDNSSCDSGIAFTTSFDNNNSSVEKSYSANENVVQSRRRKPATPHRILCPSPVKAVPRTMSPTCVEAGVSSPGRKCKEQLTPRKSPRQLMVATSKTRRRLNQQKEHYSRSWNVEVENTHGEYKRKEDDHGGALGLMSKTEQEDREFENLEEIALCEIFREPEKHTAIKQGRGPTKNQNKSKIQIQKAQPKTKYQTALPLVATNGNRELTEFFPVRRSVRKTKSAVKEEMMRNLEQAILEEREEGLKIAHFEGKGRGIVADRRFQRGEFVVEYVGDLISMSEAAEREKRYALDENAGCYMYYFKHKNQQYCIDATIDTGKLGRLVNHSRNGNLITKVVVVKQRPHLILIAKDNIEPGEELTYDYGDRSKESLLHHPWLAF